MILTGLIFLLILFVYETIIKSVLDKFATLDDLKLNYNSQKEQYLLAYKGKGTSFKKSELPANFVFIGNADASNELVVILNPYCAPCAIHYIEAYNSLFLLKNVKVLVNFTSWNEKQHTALSYISTALAKNQGKEREIIFDWFTLGLKRIDDFLVKYNCRDMSINVQQVIKENKKWCENMKIMSTPTMFYNGVKLPKGYRIVDIINV